MPKKLLHRFKSRFRPDAYKTGNALMPDLVEYGQDPEYMIISCADSRSDPATIFDTDPGVFFGFKSIGAIVRPYKKGTALSASLQYAINFLGIKKLILMGHTHCGAIKALNDKIEDPEISEFINVTNTAIDTVHENLAGQEPDEEKILRCAEKEVLLLSAQNLKSYPSVAKALDENRLEIELWIFDMKQGEIIEI